MEKMQLHIGYRSAPIRDGGNKGHAELLIRSFFTVGHNFTASDAVPR